MARNHARVLTAIWSDEEFVCLSMDAQRMYLLLLSQPDLTPCGALPYIPKRWARLCPDTTSEGVGLAVCELEHARFVLVDRDTDELVIRTFVVHDGGLANSKMRGAVKSSLTALHSRWLRGSIVDVIPDEYRPSIVDGLSIERRSNDGSSHSGLPMRSNAEVGGRRQGLVTPSSSASSGGAQSKPAPRGTRLPEDFDLTAEREVWAHERCPGLDVVLHHERFVNYWRSATRNAAKSDWDATWRNWMLGEFDKMPKRRPLVEAQAEPKRCPTCANTGRIVVNGDLIECDHAARRTA